MRFEESEKFARRTRVASLNPSYTSTKPSLNPKNCAIHRARVASSRRVSTSSRSIVDEKRSLFRCRAFVSAENVPVRESALICHGGELKSGEVTNLSTRFDDGDN